MINSHPRQPYHFSMNQQQLNQQPGFQVSAADFYQAAFLHNMNSGPRMPSESMNQMVAVAPALRRPGVKQVGSAMVNLTGPEPPTAPKVTKVPTVSPTVPSTKKHLNPPSPQQRERSATIKKAPLFKAKRNKHILPYKKRRPSINTQERCSRKRVRFQQDPTTNRIIRKVIYGRVTLTAEEKRQLWWDKQIKKSTKRVIRLYQGLGKGNKPSFSGEMESDDDERSVSSLSREDFTEKYRQALDLCASTESVPLPEDIPTISDTPIRGLEQRIFPEAVVARQQVVAKVVAAQRKLPQGLTPEQQSKLLRAASQNLTRRSRMLARLYGIGDAQVAASMHER